VWLEKLKFSRIHSDERKIPGKSTEARQDLCTARIHSENQAMMD
jgi:hypothetical protein